MTAKQVFEGMLIELSKVHAPSLLLEDFNYLFNKAVNLYINKRYNIYDVNLQTTDDLRVLKSTAIIDSKKSDKYSKTADIVNKYATSLFGSTYEVNLPSDYLHILSCVCLYKVNKTYKCYDAGSYVPFSARRLTADAWSLVINDYYNRPAPQRPYYYIHNVNSNNELPTNPVVQNYNTSTSIKFDGTDLTKTLNSINEYPRTIKLSDILNSSISTVEKLAQVRYGNASNVRMEIRYGKDNSVFELLLVMVDYIKAPLFIRLTQELLDLTEDTSQIMEFPDYICQEIINELVTVVMENNADPRLQTHLAVSLSIALPQQALQVQQLAQQQQEQ